ncbi:hypothetical protein K402DRAFT_399149 [Aulographum hederae CBS 113979]|uniref:C2H2-type domain-containing protein n=1 Tax=Aulographum hederae CBS 113979 TaxID=1176131 RepID=A0A6G1GII5_9PEZI|nr:hypothetical protein K402DRAFT_399149 [Aulographum hederae CBS 113979]
MSEPQAQAPTTQPQQTQIPVQPPAVNNVATPNVASDSLTCQWSSCGERCATAEQLYDHVCERHVGRKSTNNLNLTCQWGNCRTTTVKRDHITSHIRVHVPLKPHKCDFCGKAFKRPQDLKKHVKTHADDSVLLRSPEPNRAGPGNGYHPNGNKLSADLHLQTLAATASGYYPENGLNGTSSYYQNPSSGGYHAAAPPSQTSAYGPVYYAVNQAAQMTSDYEVRKRAAFDALNEFFGDAKRRTIDPSTYYDVGQRLMAVQGVEIPGFSSHYQPGMQSYGSGGTMAQTASHPPMHQHQPQYSLPLPNLRTKNDLVNIDQFLEQLQSTVYENSNNAAAAGVAQPGAHYVHSGINYRSSNSPPHMHAGSHYSSTSSNANSLAPLSASATETPALTPASSVMSYNSGHSPNSVHSQHNISPIQRPNAGSMYPTLPSVSAMSDMNSHYSTASSSAPASALAASFDSDGRRRYSGGLLQKAAIPRDEDRMDTSNDDTPVGSPKERQESVEGDSLRKDVRNLQLTSPTAVDPALRSPGQASDGSGDQTDKQQEAWVENIRMIEGLRNMIKNMLDTGEFQEGEREAEARTPTDKTEHDKDAESLYPVLRAVQEG